MIKMEDMVPKLVASAWKCFTTENQATFEEDLKNVTSLVNSITAKDLNFVPEAALERFSVKKAPVLFIPVCKNETFCMRIFAIRPGGRVPLHDHPEMYGLCKIIHGSLHLKSFTKIKGQCIPQYIKDQCPAEPRPELKPVCLHQDRVVNMSDNCILLTPNEGNFHVLESVGGMAAFFDLLAPPYGNEDHRMCHYYETVESDSTSVKWLKQIPTPSDFHSTRMDYLGPPVE